MTATEAQEQALARLLEKAKSIKTTGDLRRLATETMLAEMCRAARPGDGEDELGAEGMPLSCPAFAAPDNAHACRRSPILTPAAAQSSNEAWPPPTIAPPNPSGRSRPPPSAR